MAGIYLLINASWSLDRSAAYLSGLGFFVLIGALHVTVSALRLSQTRPLQAMAIGLCVGMLICSLFLSFEIVSAQWMHRLIMNQVRWLRPDLRHLELEGGWITSLQPYLLNRSVAAWTLLFWPTLLVLGRLDLPRSQLSWLGLAGLMIGIPAVYLSDHDASKLAFLGGAVIYVLWFMAPALARRLVIAGWVSATLLVVPLTMIAFSSKLYLSSWLAESGKDRVVFWNHTSRQVWKAPIFGVGINTSSVLHRLGDDNAPLAPGSDRRLSIRHHPHNGYLQTWYETGAVGALFLLVFGLLVLRSVTKAPLVAQPYLYATFVTCALIGAASFSLWHAWVIALFGFSAIFGALGTELATRE
jgi:O-antigen ligase